ncbi:hypothetical protein BHG07_07985 [Brenneria salicis ATCC 15712 = DSM 30166]|nr:hypothetical protein BHG07_07985 [Brenneria salicis ATCC 15712 = DSM 30166]
MRAPWFIKIGFADNGFHIRFGAFSDEILPVPLVLNGGNETPISQRLLPVSGDMLVSERQGFV